ncbi:hypothetical protein [Streptomyces sp. NPDC093225]|uniref:hypothetical protein n=1 Tax=Streptomyces sp. NPDC093225 TaxID=3366034 RepID=UPI00382CF646
MQKSTLLPAQLAEHPWASTTTGAVALVLALVFGPPVAKRLRELTAAYWQPKITQLRAGAARRLDPGRAAGPDSRPPAGAAARHPGDSTRSGR